VFRVKHDWSRRYDPKATKVIKASERFTNLLFTCETTGKPAEYEVPSDADTVRDFWRRNLLLTYPHCREVHCFAFRDAFIAGALAITSWDATARDGPVDRDA
jgi:hypothetical protein